MKSAPAVSALAAAVPFVVYLATTSGYGYWLDSGEFVAAAANLGIAHPPGEPLTALLGRALCMLPVGSLAWRMGIASAVLAALAAAALFRATAVTLRQSGQNDPAAVYALSLSAAWTVAFASGFWLQAVRPEVYALQACLSSVALERCLTLSARWPTSDLRPLYQAALALGLTLANHHLLALVVGLALLPMLLRVVQDRGLRPLLRAACAATLGLVTYAYLPLRASAAPEPNLGDPDSLERLVWVASAQVFQKNTGAGVPQPLWERAADVIVHLADNMHVAFLLALAGLYVVIRVPALRRSGSMWALLLLLLTAARAWLGFVRSNPDAHGYLMLALAAVAGLAAIVVALLLTHVSLPGNRRGVVLLLGLFTSVLAVAQARRHVARASLTSFHATDSFDEDLWRRLPPRSVVFAHGPQTVFRLWGAEAEEQLRPDVTLVPLPFVPYPHMVESLLAEAPELRPILRSYLLDGTLQGPPLQSLAAKRPVRVEMDVRLAPSVYRSLVPDGLLYAVLAGGTTGADQRAAARTQLRRYAELYQSLGAQRDEPSTREQLLWHHYTDALYYAGFGDRRAARTALHMALSLQPLARPLTELQAALADGDDDKPLDVRPFLALDR